MKFTFTLLALMTMLYGITLKSYGQEVSVNTLGKGIVFTPNDQSYELKLGALFQNLYVGELNLDSNEYSDQMLIRRARLKLEGFVYDPRFKFKLQFGFSNRDTRNSSTVALSQYSATANIVLDAVAIYKPNENFELFFGQAKMPGNKERMISSQSLQFVDRSATNSTFNLDRDFGIQIKNTFSVGDMVIKDQLAISTGEGRNITSSNAGGYAYTARVELLPFGEFANKGDYTGADLEREPTPKLTIGAAYDFNNGAVRSRGRNGSFVYSLSNELVENDLKSIFVDALFKYQGLSASAELAQRTGLDTNYGFETGIGKLASLGYLYKNNIETAVRFATLIPDETNSTLSERKEYTLGVSKYIAGHNLKLQSDVTYSDFANASNELQFRFQVNVGF